MYNEREFTNGVFARVKTCCVELSTLTFQPPEIFNPNSSQLIDRLQELLQLLHNSIDGYIAEKGHDPHLSTSFGDYVFVPLAQLFQKPNLSDAIVTNLLSILSLLIRFCWSIPTINPKLANQLFPLIVFLMGGSPNNPTVSIKSDALKLAGVSGLHNLFQSLSNSPNKDFFQNIQNLPPLGHCITVLLEICVESATTLDEMTLTSKTIDTLRILYFDLINDGEILSHVLPGNVSKLSLILSMKGGSKVHFTVLIHILRLLGDLLSLVFDDYVLQSKHQEIASLEDIDIHQNTSSNVITIPLFASSSNQQHRTTSWLKATSAQVKVAILSFINELKKHNKLQVRQNTLEFIAKIFKKSFLSLYVIIPNLIDIISYIVTDPNNKELVEMGQSIVLNTSHIFELSSLLKGRLEEYLDSIPTILNTSDSDRISILLGSITFNLAVLKKITGESGKPTLSLLQRNLILKLRADFMNKTIGKKSNKQRKIDNSDLVRASSESYDIQSFESKNLHLFDGLYTQDVENDLSGLIQSVCSGNDIETSMGLIEDTLLVDYGEGTQDEIQSRSISLWISTNLLRGSFTDYEQKRVKESNDPTDEFLNIDEEYEDTSDDEYSQYQLIESTSHSILEFSNDLLDDISGRDHNDPNITASQAICLNSINVVASIMKQNFRGELIDYLYPVADSLASSSLTVKSFAQLTMSTIAHYCYDDSVHDLILDNSDYLIDSLSLRLSGSAITPRTPAVLLVLLKIGKLDLIEQLDDVLNSMFILLDLYHGYSLLCEQFFIVFNEIITQVSDHYLSGFVFPSENNNSYHPWGIQSMDQLFNLLDDKVRNQDTWEEPQEEIGPNPRKPFGELEKPKIQEIDGEGDSDDEEDENVSEDVQEEVTWDSPLPRSTYEMIQKIFQYGVRLLSHPSLRLKVLILSSSGKMIPLLATADRKLYAILSEAWPSISSLTIDSDIRVAIPSLELCTVFLEYGGSFMNSRFLEMWEYLNEYSSSFKKFLMHSQSVYSPYSKVASSTSISLPSLDLQLYQAFVELSLIGLNNSGRSIPDLKVMEIIKLCLPLVKDISKFKVHSDIAWLIRSEQEYRAGIFRKEVPKQVQGELRVYDYKVIQF